MTDVKRGREFLHTPGPTNIPDRILNAMHQPAVDFTAPPFVAMTRSCFADIKPIFQTEGPVFMYAANGHGAWEAALSNTLSPGDHILLPETGNFSLKWGMMAESLGLVIEHLPGDWRRAVDPDAVEQHLRDDDEGRIKAVLMVHVDTATGIASDVPAVRKAMNNAGHNALFMVDTIASLATMEFQMDEWGVDVALAASQKGLMCPPGLGFTACSEKAMHANQSAQLPRNYWDWQDRMTEAQYIRFCGTAPIHLLYGLREALDMLAEEGLGNTIARHQRLSSAIRAAVDTWCAGGEMAFNATVPEQRSNSITAIRVPGGFNAEEIRTMARERFQVSMGGGLDRLSGIVFRIGHMGDLNEPMILGALGGVEATLLAMGIPHGRGGVRAAIEFLVEN
ncbi:MAG: aminotransferase class V-fold PLP-dependent enzyme [Alphaproteobacteria bacterium]|nr:aminotransferase class V-fold PLP-dependent enzyme [Alphaproteobacteria bacterium]